jgi:eukaryotic-like serine/threonine-protein kinase
VVATCRIEEMKDVLKAFIAHPRVARETLVRFDRAAVKEMIGGMLALADPPVALVDFVAEESRGNPFFIAEYLRSSIEAGVLRRDAAGRWRMAFVGEWADLRERVEAPPTIAAVVALRIKDVDQSALGVLAAAAVLGREFDVELVARTANCDTSTVLSAYAILSPRRILEEDGSGTSRFAHDKLREIAYAGIGPEARTELHRRAVAALEERYAGRDLTPYWGELGYHHAKAGAFALAADYYQQAGRSAQNAYANRDALRFLQLALEQLEGGRGQRTELTDAEVAVHEDIGDVLLVLGKPQEARASLERALVAATGQAKPIDKARRRRKIAQTWEREHRHDEALGAYARAEEALEQTPAAESEAREWWNEYVQIQVDKAWDLYFSARVEELAALVERVRPAVIGHASPAQKTRFLQGLVQAASKRDRMRINDETLEHSRAQLEAATQCNDLRELANARFTRAFVLSMRGLQEDSEPLFLAALDDARRLDDALLQARVEAYYAIVHRRLGRQEEARAAAERLLAFTEERKMYDYVGVAHANLAWCGWRTESGADVEHHAREALRAWDKLRPAYIYPLQWLARMPLAAWLHAKNRIDESLENCRLMLADPQHLLPEELATAIERAVTPRGGRNLAAVMEIARSHQFL